jgi:hypothetical protein
MFILLFADGPGLTDTEAGQYKSGRTGYRCFLNKISTFHEVI